MKRLKRLIRVFQWLILLPLSTDVYYLFYAKKILADLTDSEDPKFAPVDYEMKRDMYLSPSKYFK